ncbi:unnamed protein product [Mytilus coruscus]|uniref:Uncharacterized protein n=1 Tax=Mytilus coruscus TaxID=42192 RepID=A0A6J8CH08_MYTCO|nr:unnamed protein product [Mytilus coruscus]
MEDEPDLTFIGASLLILVVASILFIVGLSTPYFSETKQDTYRTYNGLWKHCLDRMGKNEMECEETVNNVTEAKDLLKVCKAMLIFGLLAILTSAFCVAFSLCLRCKPHERRILRICGIVTTFFAVVFILIGIVVYPDIARDVVPGNFEPYYGSSYTLCVVAISIQYQIILIKHSDDEEDTWMRNLLGISQSPLVENEPLPELYYEDEDFQSKINLENNPSSSNAYYLNMK